MAYKKYQKGKFCDTNLYALPGGSTSASEVKHLFESRYGFPCHERVAFLAMLKARVFFERSDTPLKQRVEDALLLMLRHTVVGSDIEW